MRNYRTLLGQRDGTKRDLPLTPEEALDLREAGFHFSEFREDTGRYRLSMPYTVAIVIASGVLGPPVTGNGGLGTVTAAVAISLTMHVLARRAVGDVED